MCVRPVRQERLNPVNVRQRAILARKAIFRTATVRPLVLHVLLANTSPSLAKQYVLFAKAARSQRYLRPIRAMFVPKVPLVAGMQQSVEQQVVLHVVLARFRIYLGNQHAHSANLARLRLP